MKKDRVVKIDGNTYDLLVKIKKETGASYRFIIKEAVNNHTKGK